MILAQNFKFKVSNYCILINSGLKAAKNAIFMVAIHFKLEILRIYCYSSYMEKYVSYVSAAKMWDIPYLEAVLDLDSDEARKEHITVAQNSARFYANKKCIHSCGFALPTGAVVMQRGERVASPELLFLELAGKLSIHRLILLGLQLCSHPPGLPDKAISTKQKLEIFLARTSGHQGHRKALRAIQYVESGSASIMESLAYMILALPHALGVTDLAEPCSTMKYD